MRTDIHSYSLCKTDQIQLTIIKTTGYLGSTRLIGLQYRTLGTLMKYLGLNKTHSICNTILTHCSN